MNSDDILSQLISQKDFDVWGETAGFANGEPPEPVDFDYLLKAIKELEEEAKPRKDSLAGRRVYEVNPYMGTKPVLKFKRHRGRHKRQVVKVMVPYEATTLVAPGEMILVGEDQAFLHPVDYARVKGASRIPPLQFDYARGFGLSAACLLPRGLLALGG